MSDGYPTPFRRMLITVPAMIASMMVAVDITIANVALPHMQATLSASQEQIIWVLTSYIMAAAIATPLSGWLAGRFGRKLVMVTSVFGFTVASVLCGMANNLQMIVLARIVQGGCGAALIPLSQAILLDINPPEEYPKAMAIFSLGSMAGPILGPTLGGYLTDALSWRWVFFINVPFGVIAFLGLAAFLFESRDRAESRFDLLGFMTVSIALGAFQLMIDRGELLDWFDSLEIKIYAVICGLAAYLGVVHMFTAKDTFLRPEMFANRNFALGSLFSMLIGIVVYATVPMIVVMTQNLLGYTAFRTGLVSLPRALGTLVAILGVTRLVNRIDSRTLIVGGLFITGLSMLMYSRLDLYTDQMSLIVACFVQGIGGGLLFVPLSIITFSTLAPKFRNEGAAMYSLVRNVGNAIGLSLLSSELLRFTAGSRAHLIEGVRPDNPLLQSFRPEFDFYSTEALARMNAEISLQASMVGNVKVYWIVFLLSMLLIPMVLLMRKSNPDTGAEPVSVME